MNNPVIDEFGTKRYHQDGKLHRLDGAALEHANGNKSWYQKGKLHRLDGADIEWANGTKYWFYKGKYINCFSQKEFEIFLRFKAFI